MNVIWIVSDTVRRKDIGVYGNDKVRTPAIDALAAKSVRFDRYYGASFPTMPTRADYMTGKWTLSFMQWVPIPPGHVLLAELLRDNADVHTVGIVDTPFFIRDGMNYDRGFTTFVEIPDHYFVAKGGYNPPHSPYRKTLERRPKEPLDAECFAPKTFTKAMEWLTLNYKEDFFLYIDTWDPHEPWNAPLYYTEPYWPGYDGEQIMPFYKNWKEQPGFTEEMLKKAHAAYLGEISMVDAWIGNLLRQVEYMGLMENTAIIFTTDHGFYFGEHDIFGKMVFDNTQNLPEEVTRHPGAWARSPLYEEIAAIPLTIYVPGVKPGVYDGLASAVDMMPTILDLFGQEIPSYVEGKSLVPAVKDTKTPGREVVFTACPFINAGDTDQLVDHLLRRCVVPSMTTVTTDEWSFLHDCAPGGSELYNLKSDPDQLNNVIGQHPDIARDMHKYMVGFMRETNVPQRLQEPRLELKL
ncbi:MAG TPA: sulfatase-like hydrolase/transferase [Dehalococcoidia bacterium]|nr:sulfatase-like hydrolase/transferase [Dehalococcoidia bacterium]